jgi:uncharacterized membrane protein
VAATTIERPARNLHPVHTILLVSVLPLFLGALLSDLAYGSSYQVQWKNFASWLIAGGLVFAGLALLWAIIDALRVDLRGGSRWLYPLLLLATFVVGFVNALVHAKDAWSSMPAGTILSIIMLILALVATWIGLSVRRAQP